MNKLDNETWEDYAFRNELFIIVYDENDKSIIRDVIIPLHDKIIDYDTSNRYTTLIDELLYIKNNSFPETEENYKKRLRLYDLKRFWTAEEKKIMPINRLKMYNRYKELKTKISETHKDELEELQKLYTDRQELKQAIRSEKYFFNKFTVQNGEHYINKLSSALQILPMKDIQILAEALLEVWINNRCVYICGNGGSAGNAIHLANDFIYGAGIKNKMGLRVEALSANPAVISCLANDLGYDNIYSEQIKVKGNPKDILLVLSGSGNSPNIINALRIGNKLKMKTFAILGFNGGQSKNIAQFPIHSNVDDMQIAEDLQLIIGHICMQWLNNQEISVNKILIKD